MRVQFCVDRDGGPAPIREVEAEPVRLGRDPACEIALDPDRHPMVSGEHARIEAGRGGARLVPASRTNQTLLNGQPLDGPAPLRPGDRVRLGATGPTVEILDLGPAEGDDRTIRADDVDKALLRGSAHADRFEVGAGGVLGRDPTAADFVLDHPHVSRRHARLEPTDDGRAVLTDLGSANGTYVNGRRVARAAVVGPDDRIDVGPFCMQFDGTGLIGRSRADNVELAAVGLRRVVKDRATGRPLVLLDDVSLVVRPREFICLLGPSGSGKSTLLAMLAGRNPPDAGRVLVDGADLYANFEAIKKDIAVVPQKDVLHDALAVGHALRYTAELRLPPDTTAPEVEASIADMLEIVGLTPRRGTLIRHLSGGQVKRASLANELVARPSLLFLDEVTSGLDEQTDRGVMELFRRVADGGKTVVCITHGLANVEATCHLVAILAEGGRLAFVGTPDEAKAYFGIPRLGEVYRALAERPAEAWAEAFRRSPYFVRYVADRLGPLDAGPAARRPAPTRANRPDVGALRQAWVLGRRYVSIWRGEWSALAVLIGQAALVAALLVLVFGDVEAISDPAERVPRTVNLILLATVSCFWFGCNTAAKELVKERVIYLRERAINLSVGGYFASKFAVLATIGAAQATALFGIVKAGSGLPGPAVAQAITFVVLAVVGTALGLLISAAARSEEVATALVPVAVIPQIILAGVVAPLSGLALAMARGGVAVYWGRLAFEGLLPEADRALLGRESEGWAGPLGVVALQGLVAAAATLFALWQAGRAARR